MFTAVPNAATEAVRSSDDERPQGAVPRREFGCCLIGGFFGVNKWIFGHIVLPFNDFTTRARGLVFKIHGGYGGRLP